MENLGLVQNTKEWEELRKTKLGASDANIIMNVSEYCTPRELWLRKKGLSVERVSNDFAKNKGHRLEEKYRAVYELETDLEWPSLVAISDTHPFLMASLDGYNESARANWECKYVGQSDFEIVKSGKMLDKYFPQVQMQLFVTGAIECHFLCATDDKESDFKFKKTVLIVNPDYSYIQNLIMKMTDFWESLGKNIEPEIGKDDVEELSGNKELSDLLDCYKQIDSELTIWENKVKEIKEKIFSICKSPKSICNGYKVTISTSEAKDKIDYERLVADKNIVIDKEYISKGKPVVKKLITVPKDKK